ncbi:peptidoglycan-binding protein [Streptomyces sp. NPDC048590]|uniref:peptidoglycan-binding domain-containing protein n=1 Tax=Streptomyces sp. NPDC048590 TaxID=3365574 RepID=UPI003719E6E7
MRAISRKLQVLLSAGAMTAAALSLAVATGAPAQAATYSACNTTKTVYTGNYEYVKVPSHSNSGLSCNLKLGTGSKSAVKALQDAIMTCYSGTAAYDAIRNSGGVDGVYGAGTVKAVKLLQKNQLGFTGSAVDGVYGPNTRKAMYWQLLGKGGIPLYPWMCKNPTQV